jgi:surface polysaccharide O-acyltransferase-like enzyme
MYLWLCASFYYLGIIKFFSVFKPNLYKKQIDINDFFPVINNQYWFFTAYFGMYLFLPVINKGLESINKSQLKVTVFSFIIIFSILQVYMIPKSDPFQLGNGISVLWLITFYITGAFFGKFKKDSNCFKKIVKCIICILVFYYSCYLCIHLTNYQINYNNGQILKNKFILFLQIFSRTRLNSISMVLQAITIILFLTTINYNKYIAKIISFIGPLTFGVYLIHDNPIIRGVIMRDLLKNYPRRLPLNIVYKIILLEGLKIFGFCITIDYLRNLLFRILQIRKICILLEKLIFILFG